MNALNVASEVLRNDKEFIITVVQKNAFALVWASYEMKNDKEVVLAAVQNDALR